MCNKKSSGKLGAHSVQEAVANDNAEIRINTGIKTSIKINENWPDIVISYKREKENIIIEVEITCQDDLTKVDIEKPCKYDVLENELGKAYR